MNIRTTSSAAALRLLLLCAVWAGAPAWSADQAATPSVSTAPAPRAVPDTMTERVAACVACHGDQGRAASDGYYPRIAGKPEGYLYNQLVNFREGRRRNTTMNYLVANLPDAYLREIARHFAARNPPYPPPQPVAAGAAVLARGQVLASTGDPARKLPACASCHGSALTGVAPAVPGLLGLPRDYLNAQIGAWQNRARSTLAPDCMAQIAARLTADDLGAVTAYLAAQPVPEHAAAAPAGSASVKPPLECGSLAGSGGAP